MAQSVIVGEQEYEFPDGMSDADIATALKLDATPTPAESSDQGFVSGVKGALGKFGKEVMETMEPKPGETRLGTIARAPERALQFTGETASLTGDIVGEGIKAGYKAVVPDAAQEAISSGLKSAISSPLGQLGVDAFKKGASYWNLFKKSYPDAAKDIESAANIGLVVAGSGPAKKAVGTVGTVAKEGIATGKDVSTLATITRGAKTADTELANSIRKGIEKGIRPTVVGKGTFVLSEKAMGKAQKAVESIIANKGKLKFVNEAGEEVAGELPKNLRQFSQAIDQVKGDVFTRYDAMAKGAGSAGATIDASGVSGKLAATAKSKVLSSANPKAARYAEERASDFAGKTFTAQEAQEAISVLNKKLDAFYKAPSYDMASEAAIDEFIARQLRASLDQKIEGAFGPGYQTLKNEYGALKSIEREVSHRAVVDARKNIKGLFDITDVATGAELARALMTMNPVSLARAGAMDAIKRWIKFRNDPNHIVKGMFGDAEKLIEKRTTAAGSFMPQSAAGKMLKGAFNPPMGGTP